MPDSTISESRQSGRGYFWLLPLFVGSGCAALIYEIVWFQSLQLVVGASAISLAVLLTVFMGGMCLGSVLLPKIVPSGFHPLCVYAVLEFGIGLLAIGLLYGMPAIERLYVESVGHGSGSVLLRAIVAGACLLPPTVFMGATLPAIARWFENSRDGTARIGLFYCANIVGAVVGCLGAGFFLLRLYDVVIATSVAIAINFLVGIAGYVMSRYLPYQAPVNTVVEATGTHVRGWQVSHFAIGLSGFAALGAEVVWTRELSLLLGASVYTFSLILAVFLIGLSLGSSLGAAWARATDQPGIAFAFCQLAAGLGASWATWMMERSLPYWPIDPSYCRNPWYGFQLDFVRVMWAVLPAAICWGCSFPLALATASRRQDPAKLVASVYSANTLGAILGALSFGLLAIPLIGMQHSQQALVGISLIAALVLYISRRPAESRLPLHHAGMLLGLTVGVVCILSLPERPPGLTAYGRYFVTWRVEPDYIYTGDGLNSSIAVSESSDGFRNFHVCGKVEASTDPQDMRLQRMLGHLPALLCDEPKSVLIVGCGAGVTAGSFVLHPTIERIVICEIEPLIPQSAGKYFAEQNHHIIQDPRLEIILDDARHFMLTTREKFDIITSDPIHPWVKGAATLYSKEYFELCRQHLKPGGVATQWVPLYESSMEAVKSEVATFFAGFAQGTIWSNDSDGLGYDLVMLGQEETGPINIDALNARLASPEYAKVVESLDQVRLGSTLALMSNYAGRKENMGPWLADAQLNTDRNLRLQYLAGWALNENAATMIRDSMKPFIRFSDGLFVGNSTEVKTLNSLLESRQVTDVK